VRKDSEGVRRLRRLRDEHIHRLFRAGGELGDPVRSYVARLIAIEDILISLPVDK
jgi:hypothetical protein